MLLKGLKGHKQYTCVVGGQCLKHPLGRVVGELYEIGAIWVPETDHQPPKLVTWSVPSTPNQLFERNFFEPNLKIQNSNWFSYIRTPPKIDQNGIHPPHTQKRNIYTVSPSGYFRHLP